MGAIMDSIICASTCAYINKVGRRTCDWLEAEARKAEREAQERAEAELDETYAGEETAVSEPDEACEIEEIEEEESAADEPLDVGQISYNILASSWPLFAKLTKTMPLYEERAAKYEAALDR